VLAVDIPYVVYVVRGEGIGFGGAIFVKREKIGVCDSGDYLSYL
jgi:hypothetical protein